MAEDIDFKFPLKRACTTEIQSFCPGMQHGHANIVRSANLTNLDLCPAVFCARKSSAENTCCSEAQEVAIQLLARDSC